MRRSINVSSALWHYLRTTSLCRVESEERERPVHGALRRDSGGRGRQNAGVAEPLCQYLQDEGGETDRFVGSNRKVSHVNDIGREGDELERRRGGHVVAGVRRGGTAYRWELIKGRRGLNRRTSLADSDIVSNGAYGTRQTVGLTALLRVLLEKWASEPEKARDPASGTASHPTNGPGSESSTPEVESSTAATARFDGQPEQGYHGMSPEKKDV
jgi:hypothetical protein